MELLKYVLSDFWIFCGFFLIFALSIHYTANGILRLISRTFRTIMVLSRGWPPSHLDADGDFKDAQHETIEP